MSKFLFPLNDTVVMCLAPYVVQVSCKAERAESIDTITTFYLAQHELSELVLRIITAHLENPLPSHLTFDSELYVLHARWAPWNFGKTVVFKWGGEALISCDHKWTFILQAKPRQLSTERAISSL
ncbi:hypothetical protein BD413DRAFT_167856 [Trametes elegans]|nr:hypothetical protein BD413DRAFT_167856 [Trametes elegans]